MHGERNKKTSYNLNVLTLKFLIFVIVSNYTFVLVIVDSLGGFNKCINDKAVVSL